MFLFLCFCSIFGCFVSKYCYVVGGVWQWGSQLLGSRHVCVISKWDRRLWNPCPLLKRLRKRFHLEGKGKGNRATYVWRKWRRAGNREDTETFGNKSINDLVKCLGCTNLVLVALTYFVCVSMKQFSFAFRDTSFGIWYHSQKLASRARGWCRPFAQRIIRISAQLLCLFTRAFIEWEGGL